MASMTHRRDNTIPASPHISAGGLNPKVSPAAIRGQVPRNKTSSAFFGAALLLVFSLIGEAAINPCWGEQKPQTKLLYLVARRSIEDPLFAKSVVLMLELKGEPLVVGLIVNKPTDVRLQELFPENRLLKGRADTAYVGGPVDPQTPALVFHSSKPFDQAMLLYDDVYVTFDMKFIAARLKDPKQVGDLRLFLGRAQWAPKQLQDEAFRGSWYSLRAEGDVIFEGDSEHLWQRMHERARPPSSVEYIMPQTLEGRFWAASSGLLRFSLPIFPAASRIAHTTLPQ
jgi:putative transcriptional regulator